MAENPTISNSLFISKLVQGYVPMNEDELRHATSVAVITGDLPLDNLLILKALAPYESRGMIIMPGAAIPKILESLNASVVVRFLRQVEERGVR